MSKRLILILALAFVVGLCATTYAAVQNVKVSGDLDVKGVLRNSIALADNPSNVNFGESITAILSTVRLRVDADLTDNVSTTVRLLNERVWGEEDSASTDIDLDLAYVTLKEFLYSPLTLTVGRQELRFGNGLIIGDPDTNGIAAGHTGTPVGLPISLDDLSSRKAFDAIRATLNYDPLVVDLVMSKIDENNVQQYDGVDLYGANAAYKFNKDLMGEAYLWQRSRDVASTTGITKAENLRTAGAKALYTGTKDLALGLEGAFQFGDHAANVLLYPDEGSANNRNRKVTAYAIQAIASRAFPKVKYTPSARFSYTYLSGDKYSSLSDNYRGWSPMFEDQAGGTLFNKILGYSNAQLFNLSGSMKPMDDVTATLDYYYLRANQPFNSTGTVVLSGVTSDPAYTMKNKKGLGSEIDLGLKYDYTEDVQFGLGAGWFIPGSAFDKVNKKTASQVIGSMKVTF
ncbi:MAG: alginate export family protein [Candidatus Omnitrophota bacterium]|nr:alginate export family protein [Candidatus Omnitrophota bacterium]